LFSAAAPGSGPAKKSNVQSSVGPKCDKVQLVEHRRAYNCEIMLSKVKVPLHDLMSSVLALEESALDTDQVENLIKFCPTKEEMEVLKGYTGEKEKLGRCEQFLLELMKVPRVESKLRVFSFRIQFHSQVSDLKNSLNVVNAIAEEIRNSFKLKRIMQTILSLGNALNQGTTRGSAIGFRLDSLLKLTETRARNNKMTLMHYLCKVLADKLPEVLDFSKDLANLEPAAKIQLKFLAEEMQAITKGLEKVVQELSTSESDGPMTETFRKNLKGFLCFAEAEVRSLASLYSSVGRNVDALILYFGEDPSRCTFKQVVTTLVDFTRMFKKAHEENCKQLEIEMKKTEKDKKKCESERILPTAIRTGNVK
ncbi:formin-like protein 13, partial [Gastrolobium bilobum]|uniref:formin-like protein 13 n=1 Tax=Gastrolobium bilobum TaxID=150636 RepID=UPI002AB26B07